MNKYFIQLFLQEKMVIMPGFGVLTLVNDDFSQIHFRSDTKIDDGKLVNYICETEGIDEQTAKNRIAKFIREMESNLNKGESFDIFEFGSFSKNENGNVEFESRLVEPKPIQEEKELEIPTEDRIEKPIKQSISESKEKSVSHEHMDSIALIQALLKGDIATEKTTEQPIEKPKVEIPVKNKPVSKENNKKPLPPKNAVKVEKKDNKKKRKFPFWAIFLLISLIGITLFGWYNFDTIQKYIPFLSAKNHKSTAIEKVGIIKDSTLNAQTAEIDTLKKKHLSRLKGQAKLIL